MINLKIGFVMGRASEIFYQTVGYELDFLERKRVNVILSDFFNCLIIEIDEYNDNLHFVWRKKIELDLIEGVKSITSL